MCETRKGATSRTAETCGGEGLFFCDEIEIAVSYDSIGNRQDATVGTTNQSYATNGLNQYTSIDVGGEVDSPVYDGDGNLKIQDRAVASGGGGPVTTQPVQGLDGQVMFEYNAENRLVSIAPETPADGDTKLSFVYDYMGRRVEKTASTYSSGTWTETGTKHFVYDGWNLIEETDGAETKYYVWGLDLSQSLQGAGGIGGLIASIDGEMNALYFEYDANGNVGQVVDGNDASIAARYEYDAFGNTIVAEGSDAAENPYRFSTKYTDESGLVYYGYRYYLPEVGRWNRLDPIEDGVNWYAFLQNSPNDSVDMFGLWKLVKDLSGEIWQAEAGDDLVGLATMKSPLYGYGADPKDIHCLWPVGDTQDNGYLEGKVKPCDKYDASNLAKSNSKSLSLKIGVDETFFPGMQAIFGNDIMALNADLVAPFIATETGEGANPISFLLVAGHSGYKGISGRWGDDAGIDRKNPRFTTERLLQFDKAPSFDRARKKKGPVRCWFTRDAVTYFAGCNSNAVMAEPFAAKVLRRGALAYGTNDFVYFSRSGRFKWGLEGMGLGLQSVAVGKWKEASVWDEFKGKQ